MVCIVLIVIELSLSIKYMVQLKKHIFVNENSFKIFIQTLIRLSSFITILIFYLLRVIVHGILVFCKDGRNLQQYFQKVIIINLKYLKFYFDMFFRKRVLGCLFAVVFSLWLYVVCLFTIHLSIYLNIWF